MTCNTIMTRLAVLACFNLSFCSMGTPVGNMPTTATKGHRETLSLTGEWGFRSDQNREGDVRGWGDWKYFTGTWRQVRVPITFDDCAPGMQGFRGVCWFQKKVEVPAAWKGRRVGLRFEGVNNLAKVWVNGQLAGENTAFSLPFEFSVDGLLRYGQDNLVVVRVASDNGALPPTWFWRPDCGILRDVTLIASDPCRIANVRIVAEPAAEGGSFSLRAFVDNQGQRAVEGTVAVTLVDRDKRSVSAFTSEPMQLATGKVTEVTMSGVAPGVKLWSPESPALYTAEIELRTKDGVVDRLPIRFGFRKIEVRGKALLLNGKKIYLTGFNRHEDSPKTGMALDRETARWDLTEMKKIGTNFVRMHCYPHDPSEYDLCDELGILVMGEAPLNGWKGHGGEATITQGKAYLKRMIERDFNHPCLVLWSVSNECAEGNTNVIVGIQALVAHAKALDPTRLVTHVSNQWTAGDAVKKMFSGDDIVSINEYYAELRLGSRTETYDYAALGKALTASLEQLHRLIPDKPILITECGHTSIEGCDGPQGEAAQAKGMDADMSAHTMDYLCGTTIWVWAKHPWPRGAVYGPCIFDVSPYGVVSRDRTHKHQGFFTVQKWFPELQKMHVPELRLGKPGERIEIVCHRGANLLAPENTLAAARKAVELGADYVEVDVRTTADGVMVNIHDPTVNRTTDGTGRVVELTAKQLAGLDAGTWFKPAFKGERVPELRPFLESIRDRSGVYFDVKAADLEAVIRLVHELQIEHKSFFWFGNPKQAERFRALAPKLVQNISVRDIEELRRVVSVFKPGIVETGTGVATPEFMREARRLGVKVMIFYRGRDKAEFRRILDSGAQMVGLDDLEGFLEVERERFCSGAVNEK